MPRRSIAETFARCRDEHRLALMPFLAAGYPSLGGTTDAIVAMQNAGADLLEIGFPFTDPIADGPTIQAAYTAALASGVRVDDVFAAVKRSRDLGATLPMVAMVSYSVVHRVGVEAFCGRAIAAGVDGLLMPDLPPPEAEAVCELVRAAGLDTVLLVAPTTTPARRDKIAKLCSGFVYYLSVSGVTGERRELPSDLPANVRAIKAAADVPVCVGFGISEPQHVAGLKDVADGAIVGSALVRRMQAESDIPTAAEWLKTLRAAT
jgi:tryptophan synthase alpha chain